MTIIRTCIHRLVVRALYGYTKFFDAIELKLLKGLSTGEVARILSLPRTTVRQWYESVVVNPSYENVIRKVVSVALPIVKRLKPVIYWADHSAVCKLCGARFVSNDVSRIALFCGQHLVHVHGKFVERVVDEVLIETLEKFRCRQ